MEKRSVKFGEVEFEVCEKLSVIQFDKMMTLLWKYESKEVWDIENTIEGLKIVLIDKTQAVKLDEILDWEMTAEVWTFFKEISSIVVPMIKGALDAKKKPEKLSGNINKQSKKAPVEK